MSEENPIVRNKAISAMYAGYYQRNPYVRWAGIAAFASKQVGCALQASSDTVESSVGVSSEQMNEAYEEIDTLWQHLNRFKAKHDNQAIQRLSRNPNELVRLLKDDANSQPFTYITDDLYSAIAEDMSEFTDRISQSDMLLLVTKKLSFLWLKEGPARGAFKTLTAGIALHSYDELAAGNLLVFEKAMPYLLFYERYGLEALNSCKEYREVQEVPALMIQAFELIKNQKIQEGNDLIVIHEQKDVLQPTIYQDEVFRTTLIMNQQLISMGIGESFGAQEIKAVFSASCNGEPKVVFDGEDLGDYEQRTVFTDDVVKKFNELISNKETDIILNEQLKSISLEGKL